MQTGLTSGVSVELHVVFNSMQSTFEPSTVKRLPSLFKKNEESVGGRRGTVLHKPLNARLIEKLNEIKFKIFL